MSETFLSEAEAGEYCFAELSCPDDAEGLCSTAGTAAIRRMYALHLL